MKVAEWLRGRTAWLGFNLSANPYSGNAYPPCECQTWLSNLVWDIRPAWVSRREGGGWHDKRGRPAAA